MCYCILTATLMVGTAILFSCMFALIGIQLVTGVPSFGLENLKVVFADYWYILLAVSAVSGITVLSIDYGLYSRRDELPCTG